MASEIGTWITSSLSPRRPIRRHTAAGFTQDRPTVTRINGSGRKLEWSTHWRASRSIACDVIAILSAAGQKRVRVFRSVLRRKRSQRPIHIDCCVRNALRRISHFSFWSRLGSDRYESAGDQLRLLVRDGSFTNTSPQTGAAHWRRLLFALRPAVPYVRWDRARAAGSERERSCDQTMTAPRQPVRVAAIGPAIRNAAFERHCDGKNPTIPGSGRAAGSCAAPTNAPVGVRRSVAIGQGRNLSQTSSARWASWRLSMMSQG